MELERNLKKSGGIMVLKNYEVYFVRNILNVLHFLKVIKSNNMCFSPPTPSANSTRYTINVYDLGVR